MSFTIIPDQIEKIDPITYRSELTSGEQYQSPKSEHVIRNVDINPWNDPTGNQDGIHVAGNRRIHISNAVIHRTGLDPKFADELASAVQGADVIWHRCRFKDSGKAVLIGSGDENDIPDILAGQRSIFHQCIFEGNSRRNPFMQAGQGYMIECIVKNWGRPETFHEKSFGSRAGKHAQLMIASTVFIQDDFWSCLTRGNLFADQFNQYLWPFWMGPGFMKAAYADFGGQIQCHNCYKNRSWLSIQNHRGPYMSKDSANELVTFLEENVVNTPEMYINLDHLVDHS